MAVHLNARLKTRFIPILFTAAALVSAAAVLARANSVESVSPDELPGPSSAALSALGAPDASEAPTAMNAMSAVSREELQAVMSEGTDPARLDRRPGFSPVVYAPRPGERPSTGSLNARKDEEPAPGVGAGPSFQPRNFDMIDELSVQPQEAAPSESPPRSGDQR